MSQPEPALKLNSKLEHEKESCDNNLNAEGVENIAAHESPAVYALRRHMEEWYPKDGEGFVGLNKVP